MAILALRTSWEIDTCSSPVVPATSNVERIASVMRLLIMLLVAAVPADMHLVPYRLRYLKCYLRNERSAFGRVGFSQLALAVCVRIGVRGPSKTKRPPAARNAGKAAPSCVSHG